MAFLRFLVTAGPTREPLDPVRFLSNRSSGKMGYALAKAVLAAGHRVTLVSGPVALLPPRKARLRRVETAEEMRSVVMREAVRADVIIMAAAVADYRPERASHQKIKKTSARMVLRLRKTPDILAELGRCKMDGQMLVGFAAETSRLLRNAHKKLKAKNLDWIVANRVGTRGTGFESDDNRAVLLSRNGRVITLPKMSKKKLARKILGTVLSRHGEARHA